MLNAAVHKGHRKDPLCKTSLDYFVPNHSHFSIKMVIFLLEVFVLANSKLNNVLLTFAN